MIRMTRAGRKQAIISALTILHAKKKYSGFMKGEICKQMGITSQSKIRDILHEMVRDHMITMGTSAIDGYADEIEIFALIPIQTKQMFNNPILINGASTDRAPYESLGV